MTEIKTISINDGSSLHCYTDSSFKTLKMSVNMLVPITEQNAAANGLLPAVASRATREYPDYTLLGTRLAELYGAYIDSSVTNMGGFQVLSVSVGGIAGKYAFGGENMEKDLSSILFSLLFHPLMDEGGLFPEDGFELEKRQTLEIFDAEFNDKIFYARHRALEILHGDEPAGINRYGKKEAVAKVTREEVTKAWTELLNTAQFEIFALGDCTPDEDEFRAAFGSYGKSYKRQEYKAAKAPLKEVLEEMPLAQSKLVLGYRADMKPKEEYVFKLMSAIFGGTPSSKLFANVREKMGLCYYCSASFGGLTSVMTVESGIETENIEKTKTAVFDQLEEMKKGNITDEEIRHAKLAICNSYNSVRDSLNSIEFWYLQRCLNERTDSPEEAAEIIRKITKDEIVAAANSLVLDTVYTLKGTL